MINLLQTYLKPYRKQLVLVMVLLLAQAIANLYLPDLNADIINNGVAKGDIAYILRLGAHHARCVTLVLGVISIVAVYWGSKTAMAFGRDVRSAIFRRVEAFSQTEVNLFGTPSLITRNTNDVQQVQMVVLMALNMMILAPIMADRRHHHGAAQGRRRSRRCSSSSCRSWRAFIGVCSFKALPLFKAMQVKIDRINQVMRETLSGIRVIRAFVRTRLRGASASTRPTRDLTDTSLKVNRPLRAHDPVALRHHEPLDGRDHVVRRPARRERRDADRQPDRLPHLHHRRSSCR